MTNRSGPRAAKDQNRRGPCPLCDNPPDLTKKPLLTNADILACLDHFRDKNQEYVICLSLDGAQRLIARRIITIGLVNTALAHPREVFAGPLTDRATSIIIAHNHPSGEPEPSKQDINMTQQLVAAGVLLGIPLRDHVIVTIKDHYSFRSNGLLYS